MAIARTVKDSCPGIAPDDRFPEASTVEGGIASLVTRRMASMEALAGEDKSMLGEIANLMESVLSEA